MLSTELADLKAYMAENPGAVIEDVARERKVTPRAVLEALPETMVRIGAGGEFGAAMNDVAQWGEVTLIVHTDDAIFEFTGAIPAGEVGRGYFNLMQPKGLHGHLRHERCAAIAFVERPFMGKSSAFIAFVNVDGGIMFKVFVGRDETRALRGDQLQRFHALGREDRARPRGVARSALSVREAVMQRTVLDIMIRWCGAAGVAALPGAALAATDVALLPRNLSPWNMFVNADIVVQAVMVGLAFASLVTWTIWLAKTIEVRRKTATARRRLSLLETDTVLAKAEQESRGGNDAVAQIIQSAAREAALSGGHFDDGLKERVALRLERVEAAMSRQIARGTGVLATIGATAPFVGLFGTVWGIMNSFIGISEAHTTNLAVVAPGIAEALLATALGLVAAIPAVVIYNHLTRTIAAHRALLGDASAMVLLLISREGDRGSFRLARAAE